MKIENGKLLMLNHTFDLDEIALIGIQQFSSYEEFGFETNYWLQFKLMNGDSCDIETSRSQYEGDIIRRFKIVCKLLKDELKNNFVTLGYMIVNINHVKDIRFINKNKGIELVFNDFHVDYPKLGKWRARKIIKTYDLKCEEYKQQNELQQ